MYSDPGSGLLFVQILVAGILSVTYRFRRLIASWFGRGAHGRSDPDR